MKKLIIALILCSGIVYANEVIVDFKDNDLVVLNEELRQIRKDIEDLKDRVYDLEHP
jgi:hypothetical protein